MNRPGPANRPKRLEILLVLLPVVVASIQIYLSKSSDLTSWRGGGFGMYSDPHPTLHRNVWLAGTLDGDAAAVRLSPLDDRLREAGVRNRPLRRDLEQLGSVAWNSRDFPSLPAMAAINSALHDFLAAREDEPIVVELFPRTNLRLRVVETGITPDYGSVRSRTISDRPL